MDQISVRNKIHAKEAALRQGGFQGIIQTMFLCLLKVIHF